MPLIIRKAPVRLKHMRMSADNNVNSLFHQECCPLLFIFIWHGFVFRTPVCNKNDTVTDFFGFLDHGRNFVFIKNIDHIVITVSCAGAVSSICIIQKCDFDSVDFFYFYSICIVLSRMDTEHRNIRIITAPEVQCGFQIIITIIIHVIGSRFHDIETGFDNGITYFFGCGK